MEHVDRRYSRMAKNWAFELSDISLNSSSLYFGADNISECKFLHLSNGGNISVLVICCCTVDYLKV